MMPPRIVVGIGDREWTTVDRGITWAESARRRREVRGPQGMVCNDVVFGEDGLGLAASSEPTGDPERPRNALLFLTRDGGASWTRVDPRLPVFGRLRAGAGWPPEAIESLAVQPNGLLALAWEDPWLFEGPEAHLVASSDGGATWRYARLAPGCWRLARAKDDVLRVFGAGVSCTSDDGGRSIRQQGIEISWPELPNRRIGILHEVRFTSRSEALALAYCEDADVPTPLVGLATTTDAGHHWRVERSWPAPKDRDYNETGALELSLPL